MVPSGGLPMTRKSITTSHRVVACDVCGRTLLRGEKADVFLHGGTRKMVCELCTARAMPEIRRGASLPLKTSSARATLRSALDGMPRTERGSCGGS